MEGQRTVQPPRRVATAADLAVMRWHRIITISAAFALLMGALAWFVTRRQITTPAIAIGILGYSSWGKGPSLAVSVGITNTGRTTIRYNKINFGGDASVRAELQNGWVTRDIGPMALLPWMPALLRPGDKTKANLMLPKGTLRWQVCYRVRGASLRECVASRIPPKWRGRLRPLCERLLSGREGPEREIVSELFDCPRVEPVGLVDGMPPLFDREAFWPAATGAGR